MLRSQESISSLLQDHSRAALGIASSMAVALVVGIFTGALLFGSSDPFSASFDSSSPAAASASSGTASSPLSASSASASSAPSSGFVSSSPAPVSSATSVTPVSPGPEWSEIASTATTQWTPTSAVNAPVGRSESTIDATTGAPAMADGPPTPADEASTVDRMVRPDGQTWAHVWFGDAAPMTLIPDAVPALVPWIPASIEASSFGLMQPMSGMLVYGPEDMLSSESSPQPVLSSRRR